MTVMRELFLNENLSADTAHDCYHALDLHNKIKLSCQLAQDSAQECAAVSRDRQEAKAKLKFFEPGDEVLVLLPKSNNQLVLQLQGPFKVVKRHTNVVYLIDLGTRRSLLHVNLLREYRRRAPFLQGNVSFAAPHPTVSDKDDIVDAFTHLPFAEGSFSKEFSSPDLVSENTCAPALVFSDNVAVEDSVMCCVAVSEDVSETFGDSIPTPCTTRESNSVKINPYLDAHKVNDIQWILEEFTDVLTSSPGHTMTVKHEIVHTSAEPARVRPYPLPFASQEYVRDEIAKLLEMGVIEPSTSLLYW